MLKSLKVRRRMVQFAAMTGLVVCSLATREAQARVPAGPRLDSASAGCGQIQDKYDQAVRDLEHASKHGTQAQYDAALENVKSLIRQWNGSPCARTFGSLVYRTVPVGKVTGAAPTLAEPRVNGGAAVGSPSSGSPSSGRPAAGVSNGAGKSRSVVLRRKPAQR